MTITAESPREDIVEALRQHGFDAPEGDATNEELLELLGTVTGEDYSKRRKTPRKSAKKSETQTVKVIIPTNEGVHGKGDVLVCLNGRNYSIARDMEVEIPMPVYEILKNAKTKVGRPTQDGDVVIEEQHTYPHSVVV